MIRGEADLGRYEMRDREERDAADRDPQQHALHERTNADRLERGTCQPRAYQKERHDERNARPARHSIKRRE